MRVTVLSTPPSAPHHHHHYYKKKQPTAAAAFVLPLRSVCRNQLQQPLPQLQQQSKQIISSPIRRTRVSRCVRHTPPRQLHPPQQQAQQLQQQRRVFTSSPTTTTTLLPPPPPALVSPQPKPPRHVQFEEQLSFLPTDVNNVVLTPDLIDQLWYSRDELDDCKRQVRHDFWSHVKGNGSNQQQLQPPSSPTSLAHHPSNTFVQEEEEPKCWVGMERYWDAAHISSTQRGLKQAILRAQQQQQDHNHHHHQAPHDYEYFHHREMFLAHISLQWSRSCQERAWWYASLVAESLYGITTFTHQQQHSAASVPLPVMYNGETSSSSSYHPYYNDTYGNDSTMEPGVAGSYRYYTYNTNHNYHPHTAFCLEQA